MFNLEFPSLDIHQRSIHGHTLSPDSEETRRFQRSKSEGRIRAQSFTPKPGSETLPRATRRSNDLKDAEDGFDRAKEEYKKLQQEVPSLGLRGLLAHRSAVKRIK